MERNTEKKKTHTQKAEIMRVPDAVSGRNHKTKDKCRKLTVSGRNRKNKDQE